MEIEKKIDMYCPFTIGEKLEAPQLSVTKTIDLSTSSPGDNQVTTCSEEKEFRQPFSIGTIDNLESKEIVNNETELYCPFTISDEFLFTPFTIKEEEQIIIEDEKTKDVEELVTTKEDVQRYTIDGCPFDLVYTNTQLNDFLKNVPGTLVSNKNELITEFKGKDVKSMTKIGNELNKVQRKLLRTYFDYFLNEFGDLCILVNDEPEKICNFELKILKVEALHDGRQKTTIYNLLIIIRGIEYVLDVSDKELQTSSWINTKTEFRACFYMSQTKAYDHLKRYISQQLENLKTVERFKFTGWINYYGTYVYVCGNQSISCQYTGLFGSKDSILLVNKNLNEKQAFAQLLNMKSVMNNPNTALIFISFMALAVMKSLYEIAGSPIRFSLFLLGKSGSFKTTLSLLFFQLFNRNKLTVSGSFNDTLTSLELSAFEKKDDILLLDNLAPSLEKSKANSDEEKANAMIKYIADEKARSRSAYNLEKMQDFNSRCLLVLTGETNIVTESTAARLLEIKVRSEDVNIEFLTIFQNQRVDYSTFFYFFLQYVANNIELVLDKIDRYVKCYRAQVINYLKHKRLPDSFALLMTSFNILMDYGSSIGMIDNKQSLLTNYYNNLYVVFKEHSEAIVSRTPDVLYLSMLAELLISKKAYLKRINDTDTKYQGKFLGFEDHDYMYLFHVATFDEICKSYAQNNARFPIGRNKLTVTLEENGLILTQNDGSRVYRTIKAKCKGPKDEYRYLVIDKAKMSALLNDIE